MITPVQDLSSHFGLQNIPFGIASSKSHPQPQAVSRHENKVIFLADVLGLRSEVENLPAQIFAQTTLNSFAALGRATHLAVRNYLQALLVDEKLPPSSTENIENVQMHLPVSVGDFTDFSCSEHHNLNAGHAVTGRRGLPPTWGVIPPGYAGRCSSIVISGTPVRRPSGHFWVDAMSAMKGENKSIAYGPSKMMDYELEVGAIVGQPVEHGKAVLADDAGAHIFGFVLINDWSARDIQTFEMVPLGPLNSKNSATTMSPWIIPYDALEPFRVPNKTAFPSLSAHLKQEDCKVLSIDLEVNINMAKDGVQGTDATSSGTTTCRSNSSVMAWSFEQLIAHQASAGSGLRAGDLLGIGTVSEEQEGKRGCLLEDNIPALGSAKGFLEDGSTVQFTGYCGEGVGFGECRAQLLPAKSGEVWTSS